MKYYIIKRLVYILPLVFGITVFTFLLTSLAPGDPVEVILRSRGIDPNKETIEVFREKMGLNCPLYIQYVKWLRKVIHLDLGSSLKTDTPVLEEFLIRLPATLELAICSIVVTIVLSIPLGIISAIYKNSIIDYLTRALAVLGNCIPDFWLGLLLIYLLSVKMKLFPVMGREGVKSIVLPTATLSFNMIASYVRILRATMLDVLSQDFVKVAEAKGLRRKWLISRYGLKNSLIPLITLFGMSLGRLLGGSVVVESIFAWPGIGKYIIDSIFVRDYPVIQGFVLLMALVFVFMNLFIDILYCIIDPRIRYMGGEKSE
ncbi:MAG: ABC transporter permease [Tepidanaerobacter acetatoxydans]|uniref:nickel ABC transporter permease n=1 Tax=Tepidanaerobacter acetatoxydans TaxID=499229 RepID=UPI001BD5800D|nr:nickel ABC transporter permease [Tepidanaerobacter acetatoxydans]NLU11251.1 ABC transporter permease [Tepidanaerobacter acetatoxydans]